MIKTQNKTIKAIKAAVEDEFKTVPEIAVVTQLPSNTVLLYVATLKKYAGMVEGDKDGDYFKYGFEAAK